MSIKDKYNYGERQMNTRISKCQIDMYHNMTKIYIYMCVCVCVKLTI